MKIVPRWDFRPLGRSFVNITGSGFYSSRNLFHSRFFYLLSLTHTRTYPSFRVPWTTNYFRLPSLPTRLTGTPNWSTHYWRDVSLYPFSSVFWDPSPPPPVFWPLPNRNPITVVERLLHPQSLVVKDSRSVSRIGVVDTPSVPTLTEKFRLLDLDFFRRRSYPPIKVRILQKSRQEDNRGSLESPYLLT